MNYQVNRLSIHVDFRGSGEPALVFVPYWGGTSRTWSEVADRLQDRFTVVAYDVRGWGESDKSPAGYTLADMADELLALVDTLALDTYVLVGHSMGGKIAQLAASRDPRGLAGLVLVAPAPPTPVRFSPEALDTQLHAYDNRENVLETIGFLTARPPSAEVVERIVEDSMSASGEAKLAYPTAMILEDISSEVWKISVPTLVLAGEFDRLDSIEQHKEEVVARIPAAKFGVIGGSGHLIPIDEPGPLAERIAEFVSSL